MAQRLTRKDLKQDEFVEVAMDLEQWFERHWRAVALGAGAVLVVIVAVLGGRAWLQRGREAAAEVVDRGVAQFRAAEQEGSGFDAALTTLDQAVSRAGSNPGRVARFYRAAALRRLGRFDEARQALDGLASAAGGADTLAVTAQLLLAEVQAGAGQPDQALVTLQAVVDQPQSPVPIEEALLALARVAGAAGQSERARASLRRIVDEFPRTGAAAEAREELARFGAQNGMSSSS